jgi:hypothetical protein
MVITMAKRIKEKGNNSAKNSPQVFVISLLSHIILNLYYSEHPERIIKKFHIRLCAVQVNPPASGGTRSRSQDFFIPFSSIGKREKKFL